MKFISVRRLSAALKLTFSRIDDKFIQSLRRAVDQHFVVNEVLCVSNQKFTIQELVSILDSLKQEECLVFHDWIHYDKVLSSYLISNGNILLPDEDIILSKDHQLFETYQRFLLMYLSPILKAKIAESIKNEDLFGLIDHLKFSPLLPQKTRIEIQQPIRIYLKQLMAQLKVSQEVDLEEQLKSVFSFEFVQILNGLDKSFYDDSITYFETARLIVRKKDLSFMILDRIKLVISSLNLNKDDQQNAIKFINSNAFNIRVKNSHWLIPEMVKSPFFIVAVIVVLINFVFYYPNESDTLENSSVENNTATDDLSEEELMEVDIIKK